MNAELVYAGVVAGAICIWFILFTQACVHSVYGVKMPAARSPWFTLAGLLASIGMAAANIGYLQVAGFIPPVASVDALHFIAGVGRGGMLFGGLMLLLSHDPEMIVRR